MIRLAKREDYLQLSEFYKTFLQGSLDKNFYEQSNPIYLVESSNDKLRGFLSYSIYYERVEVNYIYVHDEFRHQHIADQLLEYMINDCLHQGCESITLEVRYDNKVAILLYQKHGFHLIQKRVGYYQGIDGWLMLKELKP